MLGGYCQHITDSEQGLTCPSSLWDESFQSITCTDTDNQETEHKHETTQHKTGPRKQHNRHTQKKPSLKEMTERQTGLVMFYDIQEIKRNPKPTRHPGEGVTEWANRV